VPGLLVPALSFMTKRERQLTCALKVAVQTLAFYGCPETYYAVAIAFDPPCGGFDKDFSYIAEYQRDMPGKLARKAIARVAKIIEV
jgi:hypothetical protein